jgi:hypothetical protein
MWSQKRSPVSAGKAGASNVLALTAEQFKDKSTPLGFQSSSSGDAAALIARARDTDLLSTAQALGARLKRVGAAKHAGPCPRCGGRDRFSINIRKQVFNCRGCGIGGDAIGLVRHVAGHGFGAAVAFIGNERYLRPPRPPAPEPPARRVHDLVVRIVAEIVPIARTPGEAYLRDVRRIETPAIADVLDRIDAIGWHPSVVFRQDGHPLDGKWIGCVVAAHPHFG